MLQNAEKIMHSFIPTEPRSRHGISVPAVCHREKRVVVGGKLYIDVLTRHCVLIKIMIAFFFIYIHCYKVKSMPNYLSEVTGYSLSVCISNSH